MMGETLTPDGRNLNHTAVCWNHIRGRCSVPSASLGRVVLRRNFASPAGRGSFVSERVFATVAPATQHTTEAN